MEISEFKVHNKVLLSNTDKFDGMTKKEYERLFKKFSTEQPVLDKYTQALKGTLGAELFEVFISYVAIIWMSYKEETNGRLASVNEYIIHKISEESLNLRKVTEKLNGTKQTADTISFFQKYEKQIVPLFKMNGDSVQDSGDLENMPEFQEQPEVEEYLFNFVCSELAEEKYSAVDTLKIVYFLSRIIAAFNFALSIKFKKITPAKTNKTALQHL